MSMKARTSRPGSSRERGGQPAVGLVELADVSPGEGAEERAEGGRGADPAEDGLHRAVAQQVHVLDAVRPDGHARDQAHRLHHSVGAARAGGRRAGQQARQPGAVGEREERGQAGVHQQVRIIEHGARPPRGMQQLHLRGVLSKGPVEAW
jgi:hypothetical protein